MTRPEVRIPLRPVDPVRFALEIADALAIPTPHVLVDSNELVVVGQVSPADTLAIEQIAAHHDPAVPPEPDPRDKAIADLQEAVDLLVLAELERTLAGGQP